MYKIIVLVCSCCAIFNISRAQTIESTATFLDDSVKLGMPIGFSITSSYPEETDLIFPDSTYNFGNFEYERKEWFETNTQNGISFDSVIYFLRTFEIDSIHTLDISFFELVDGDSTKHTTPSDSIVLIHVVESIPDSLSVIYLQEDTRYSRIAKSTNYPFIIAICVVSFLIILILWYFFGDKIKSRIKAHRLRKLNEKFVEKYDVLLNGINTESLNDGSEDVLSHWKRYMEKLESLPYRRLTTKEISQLKNEDNLIDALRAIDKAIYANSNIDEIHRNLHTLKSYSQEKYEEELNRIQHGVSN